MKKIQMLVLFVTFFLANTFVFSAEKNKTANTTTVKQENIAVQQADTTVKPETTYNLNVPHTGPKNITLDIRLGFGYASALLGIVNTTSLDTALRSISTGNTFTFEVGASFIWKKLMLDVNYHVTSLNKAGKEIYADVVDPTIGVTWNRKSGSPGYGYFFVGLRNWSVSSDSTSTNVNIPSFLIGLKGLTASKIKDSNISFLYYGSWYLGGGASVLSTTNGVSSGGNTGSTFFIGLEQGLGLSFDSIGITSLIKARGEFAFAIGSGANSNLYVVSAPSHLSLNIGKLFSF